jgi:polygalacturonase
MYGSNYGLHNAAPVPTGAADRVFGIVSSTYISITNISMERTGHFAILMTDVEHVILRDLRLHPHRDGVDLIGVRHCLAERLIISGGGDDAFVLKSDYSVGRYINCENITVRDSSISTVGATALEIGSETAGNFSDILWQNISVHSAGDAAIGIVVMDGGHVSGVRYQNISADNVTSPLQFYLGGRRLCGCPNRPPTVPWSKPCAPYPPGVPRPVGSIQNVVVDGMTATNIHGLAHGGRNWTSTLDGQPEDDHNGVPATFARRVGPNITLRDLNWTYLGGGNDSSTAPRHMVNGWMNSKHQYSP